MDPDNEAPRDPRVERINSNFTELDFEGHRALSVYVGFHIPGSKHRHKHHHRRKHSLKTVDYDIDLYKKGYIFPSTPPLERIHFVLGSEEDELHKPHSIFCEMEQLHYEGEEMEWRETARWVRFEEDVEEFGKRWSKPHITTISLHHLLVLRSCFSNGTVIFDVEVDNFNDIIELILSQMVSDGHITAEQQKSLNEVLLCRHRHLHEFRHDGSGLHLIKSFAEMTKTSPLNLTPTDSASSHCSEIANAQHENLPPHETSVLLPEQSASEGQESNGPPLERHVKFHMPQCEDFHMNQDFMRKIPPDSHALNVLIGELSALEKPVTAFVRLNQPCSLGDLTEVPLPTKFLFIGMTSVNNGSYCEVGRALAALMSYEVFHNVAYKARSPQDLVAGVDSFIDAATALPAGVWDPTNRIEPPSHSTGQELPVSNDAKENKHRTVKPVCDVWKECGLRRTGRLFGGLLDDFRRKFPWYFSDFKDFIALQSIASVFFLYIACLAPVITFGGFLGDATNQRMAAMENLLSSVICGVVYGLFSGQPLTLLGTTGALLVFEGTIFSYCEWWNIDYLSFRLWIGLWTSAILFLFVAFDSCVLVCYITRFTEEIFAALISIVFIFKALENVYNIRNKFPMKSDIMPPDAIACHCYYNVYINEKLTAVTAWTREECEEKGEKFLPENCNFWQPYFVPNVFLMSVILFFTTFALTVILRKLKTTSFFPKQVRATLSDFAVIISIGSMTLLDIYIGIATPKLDIPQVFKPTYSQRGWLIPFFGNNSWWTALGAILPALIATILIFMDQEVTAIIVNRKENKLRKGCGYHLDLFVLAILIAFCSLFGLPWYVAATMLSMTHVTSLRRVSENSAPGEKPTFLGVREQRGTHICISVLIGLSMFFTPLLKHIPMPVLYGIFLYMGVMSLKGLQLLNRVLILFMPLKYQPDYIFLRHVPVKIVHLFTATQIFALIGLFVIKYFPESALCFPAVLIIVILIRRRVLVRFFSDFHLAMLDDNMPEFARRNSVIDSFRDSYESTYSTICSIDTAKSDLQNPPSNTSLEPSRLPINITELLMQTSLWKCIDQQVQKTPLLQDKQYLPSSVKRRKKPKKNLDVVEEENINKSDVGKQELHGSAV